MFPTEDDSRRLLENLSESYAVEVKRWFNPAELEGQSKLIKALMALRNSGGGRLVVGFDDTTMQPVKSNLPLSVRETYSQDAIQALVTKFASEPFEVQVQYVELGGSEFPVICVPAGVRTPVATKSELKGMDPQRTLIRLNDVYVRTLSTNNSVSTANATWKDWNRLVDICFDNREADIGRFVRRHLNETNLSALVDALSSSTVQPKVDLVAMSKDLLATGYLAFERAVAQRKIKLPPIGFFEMAVVISGDLIEGLAANQSMLNLIRSANRHLTGWPIFATLQNATDPQRRPQVIDDAWETAVICPTGDEWGFNAVDFWRIEPSGKLYAIRGYYEDLEPTFQEQRQFAYIPAIRNVADGLAEAVSIARQMVQHPESASLAVTFRWTDLNNRPLSNAYSRNVFLPYLGGNAIDDAAIATLTVPVDLPDSALTGQVSRALAPLFRKFQGFEMVNGVIDSEVQNVLKSRH